jgi:hypothetical protein
MARFPPGGAVLLLGSPVVPRRQIFAVAIELP